MRAAVLALVCALLVVPAHLSAQTVAGRVVDSATRRPLAGVTVRLVPGADSARDTVYATDRTEADGEFVLSAPRPGTYRVRIGQTHVGPPLVLATADANDAHLYPVGPELARLDTVVRHVLRAPVPLRGPALDAALREGRPLLWCEVGRGAKLIPSAPPNDPGGRPNPDLDGARLLLQFVVDTAGRAESQSLRVWMTPQSDSYFVGLVRRMATDGRHMRFTPAEADGRRVRQLVQLPLTFSRSGANDTARLDPGRCAAFVEPPPGMVDADAPPADR